MKVVPLADAKLEVERWDDVVEKNKEKKVQKEKAKDKDKDDSLLESVIALKKGKVSVLFPFLK